MTDADGRERRSAKEPALRRLGEAIDWIVRAGGYLAGGALLLMTLGVTLDVLARYVLGAGTKAALELSGYALVAIVFLGLAYTHRSRSHIEVDFVTKHLSEPIRRWLRNLSTLVFLVYTVLLGYFGWRTFWDSYDFGTTSRTGLDVAVWPYQLIIPVGLGIATLLLAWETFIGVARRGRDQDRGDAP